MAEGTNILQPISPFFYVYWQNILSLSSACYVENQSSSVGTMSTEYYVYTWVCQCHMCVWWREEAGGPCVLWNQDWLVPQRQRQDVKIQQCALKTTTLPQTAGFPFSLPHGLHACSSEKTIFMGRLSTIHCGLRTHLGSSSCWQRIDAAEQ